MEDKEETRKNTGITQMQPREKNLSNDEGTIEDIRIVNDLINEQYKLRQQYFDGLFLTNTM